MKFAFLFLLIFVFAATNAAAQNQSAANETASTTAAQQRQPLGENERLPFMETGDQAAQSSAAPGSSGLIVRTLGALCLIVGLIFAAAWSLKKIGVAKIGKTEDAPDLALVSSISLGQNRTISVVRFGQKTLLVGSTPQSFALLAEENAAADFPPPARSVGELLAATDEINFDDELTHALTIYDRERASEIG